MASALISQDTSFSDSDKHRSASIYLGANSLYPLSKKIDLEFNMQQGIDSRIRTAPFQWCWV